MQADLYLNNLFSDTQNNIFKSLNGDFKAFLQNRFLAFYSEKSLKIVKIVLKILNHNSTDKSRLECILYDYLRQSPSSEDFLKKIKVILKHQGNSLLFEMLKTERIEDPLTCYQRVTLLYEYIINHKIGNLVDLSFDPEQNTFIQKKIASQGALPLEELQKIKDKILASFSLKDLTDLVQQYLHHLPEEQKFKPFFYQKLFELAETLPKDQAKLWLKLCLFATTSLKPLQTVYSANTLQEFCHFFSKFCAEWGEEVLEKMMGVDYSLDIIGKTLEKIVLSSEQVLVADVLEKFLVDEIAFEEIIHHLTLSKENKTKQSDRLKLATVKELEPLLRRFQEVPFSLEPIKLTSLQEDYEVVYEFLQEWEQLEIEDLVNTAHLIQNKKIKEPLDVLKSVAIGIRAIDHVFGITLRPTQILTALAFLSHSEGCLCQVNTGEGKTQIINLLALSLALYEGKSIHIISSALHLSQRDQKLNAPLFQLFQIETKVLKEKAYHPDQFKAQILYGTRELFEFAILYEIRNNTQLFLEPLIPIKRFVNVIIDEYDHLALDTANHSARESLEKDQFQAWIYRPIFTFVQKEMSKSSENFSLKLLKKYLEGFQKGKYAQNAQNFDTEDLKQSVRAAHQAYYHLHQNQDYIVQGDEILIVDKGTGQIQKGLRWSKGIHEFLEIKHQITPRPESFTPISISPFPFYDLYERLYGLTGSLGNARERETIKEIYKIEAFDIPPDQASKRLDTPLLILENESKYHQYILNEVNRLKKAQRPLLILCSTIEDSIEISSMLEYKEIEHELLNDIQEKEAESILEKAGLAGAVTVATNIAGRGTDIKISPPVSEAGGLHVLLTFYPDSDRVEQQARGRAGRNGQKGSSAMIVLKSLYEQKGNQELITHLKEKREKKALIQKHHFILQAELERFVFQEVKNFYFNLNGLLKMIKDEDFLINLSKQIYHWKIASDFPVKNKATTFNEQLLSQDIVHASKNPATIGIWINLLNRIVKCIEYNLLKEFSLTLEDITDEMHKIDINPYVWMEDFTSNIMDIDQPNESFKVLLKELDRELGQVKIQTIEEFKQHTKNRIDFSIQRFQNYLDPAGLFFYDYIERLTGIRFSK